MPLGWDSSRTDVLRLVFNWLSKEENGHWLMIIDNIDQESVLFQATVSVQSSVTASATPQLESLSKFIPQTANGSILITSRDKDAALRVTRSHSNIVEVKAMDSDRGVRLLTAKLGDLSEKLTAKELVDELDGMPLAITQAAAYIQRSPHMSLSTYLGNLRAGDNNMTRLLMQDVGDDRRDGEAVTNSVMITWQLSFERIRDERPSASRLLSLMSLFDRQGIPRKLLHGQYGFDDNQNDLEGANEGANQSTSGSNSMLGLLGRLRLRRRKTRHSNTISRNDNAEDEAHTAYSHNEGNGNGGKSYGSGDSNTANDVTAEDNDQFAEDVRTLCRYALITENKEPGTFEMHRLVQLVTIAWLKHKKGLEDWKEKFIDLMYKNLPVANPRFWRTAQDLIPHVDRMLDHRPRSKRCVEQWGQVLSRAADHAYNMGRYAWAEKAFREAVNGTEGILGVKNPRTLALKCRLGWALLTLRKTTEAETLLQETLKSMKEVLGQKDRSTIECMRSLAVTLRMRNKLEEATTLLRQALALSEKLHGQKHQETLLTMRSLAITISLQGDHIEANRLLRQALGIVRETVGEEDVLMGDTLSTLAVSLDSQGRYREAEVEYRQALEVYEKVYGVQHPNTLSTMWGVAQALRSQRKYEESASFYSRACEGLKELDNPRYSDCLKEYKGLLREMEEKRKEQETRELERSGRPEEVTG
jgi:tetratricopeptide (TPR) repeat protein